MNEKNDSFKEILETIVPNYTYGFGALILPILFIASPFVLFSADESLWEKVTFLAMFILVPLILFLQSVLIGFICYFGSKVRLFVKLKVLHSK